MRATQPASPRSPTGSPTGDRTPARRTPDFDYFGPPINLNPNAPLTSTPDAIRIAFDWFNANGGLNRPNVGAALPGINRRVADDLAAPNADEIAGGVSKRLGSSGMLRVDAVYRKYDDFYSERIDTTTGQVVNDLGTRFDVIETENTNDVERQRRAQPERGWRAINRLSLDSLRCRERGAVWTARIHSLARRQRCHINTPRSAKGAGTIQSAICSTTSVTRRASSRRIRCRVKSGER